PDLLALDLKVDGDAAWRALAGVRSGTGGRPIRTLLLRSDSQDPATAMEIGSFWLLLTSLSIENTLEAVRAVGGAPNGGTAGVADADPDLRRILAEALASAGWAVRGAEDGEEALEAIGKGQTSLAILSLVLPRQDAISILARVRQTAALRNVPIFV